tara:strand:- start:4198 stop:4998 length:801 start_codon:yes stop_codon:yes gene_type:complete
MIRLNKKITGPFLIHTDIFQTRHLLEQKKNVKLDPVDILKQHETILIDSFGYSEVCYPSFNYDFTTTGKYSPSSSPSQVGVLSNFLRESSYLTRTNVPVFSFLIGEDFNSHYDNFPFESNSIFNELFANDGSIIFYGAAINSCTYLHFVEFQAGPPRYRYDKEFKGLIKSFDNEEETSVSFHVRPMGMSLDYNWNFLLKLLDDKGLVYALEKNVFAIKARDLTEVWGEQITQNDLSILTNECKENIDSKLSILQRRFDITDFEEVD